MGGRGGGGGFENRGGDTSRPGGAIPSPSLL